MKIRNTPKYVKYDIINRFFFLLGKSNKAIKKILTGKKPIAKAFDKPAGIKEIEDNGQLLNTKNIDRR